KTQYHLYYFGPDGAKMIGGVKILRKGQGISHDSELPVGPLAPLAEEFCSLGQSLDYYERLAELPRNIRDEILEFLRDALVYPNHAASFIEAEAWRVSMTRDLDLESYKPLALTLLERDYDALPSVGLSLSFVMSGWTAPLELDFAAPDNSEDVFGDGFPGPAIMLPDRAAVITGRNGSGKSTLLARLARVLHASQFERARAPTSNLGKIAPAGIGFSRIIAVAYSAFDTFHVPGVTLQDKKQIISDLRAGTGRYVFAGLRDIARELEERLSGVGDVESSDGSVEDELAPGFALDRQDITYLKSADQLADEYARTLERVVVAKRERLLSQSLLLLLADPSFSDVPDQSVAALLEADPRETFMGWSTGHKIVMHMVTTLVAYAQPKAIILMDEPESHLHPPLLAALMHAVRLVLGKQDAFAVIATHSPVVAQETLGRHVSVINRSGDVVTILPPKIETYGESIGEITNEVFGLTAGSADFHATLRSLVDRNLTLEQIEGRFDRRMSLQARAYVMSLIAARES
ncbi:AAA family ATPase, partial [Pseudoxanthobacter sp. M-2]|uniref:AAA family ATPase n=1 Tax=Pseudoxanthobacter sp. M-2 TaxID=3078754 RepID=UPI0038FD07A9